MYVQTCIKKFQLLFNIAFFFVGFFSSNSSLFCITACSNADGWTPIHLSAKNGHHSVLEFLLEQSPVRETMEIIDNEQVSVQCQSYLSSTCSKPITILTHTNPKCFHPLNAYYIA